MLKTKRKKLKTTRTKRVRKTKKRAKRSRQQTRMATRRHLETTIPRMNPGTTRRRTKAAMERTVTRVVRQHNLTATTRGNVKKTTTAQMVMRARRMSLERTGKMLRTTTNRTTTQRMRRTPERTKPNPRVQVRVVTSKTRIRTVTDPIRRNAVRTKEHLEQVAANPNRTEEKLTTGAKTLHRTRRARNQMALKTKMTPTETKEGTVTMELRARGAPVTETGKVESVPTRTRRDKARVKMKRVTTMRSQTVRATTGMLTRQRTTAKKTEMLMRKRETLKRAMGTRSQRVVRSQRVIRSQMGLTRGQSPEGARTRATGMRTRRDPEKMAVTKVGILTAPKRTTRELPRNRTKAARTANPARVTTKTIVENAKGNSNRTKTTARTTRTMVERTAVQQREKTTKKTSQKREKTSPKMKTMGHRPVKTKPSKKRRISQSKSSRRTVPSSSARRTSR